MQYLFSFFSNLPDSVPDPFSAAAASSAAWVLLGFFSLFVVRLEDFQDKDFLRHAGKFVERIGHAGAAHVERVVALLGMLTVREFNAYRHVVWQVF